MGVLITRSSIAVEPEPETFDFYIGPSGSDSNPGTEAEPWAITALNTKRATYAGTRVGLLNGTYATGGISPYAGGDTPSLGIAPGSSGSPTIVQAVNDRMAIMDHDEGGIACMGAYDSTCEYFQIRGLKFINTRDFAIYINRSSGRGLGIVVADCEFTQQLKTDEADLTAGVFFQSLTDAIVDNCLFHDIENSVQASSVAAFLEYGCIRTVIQKSSFIDVYSGPFSKYAGGDPRTDDQGMIVRQCYIKGCVYGVRGCTNKDQDPNPPTDPPYDPYIIENTVFEDNELCLSADGPHSSASPVIVRNCTIYARSAGAKQGFNLYTWQEGLGEPDYYNNIWSIGGSSTWTELRALAVTVDGAGNALTGVIDYNCYHGSTEWTTQEGYGYPYYGGALDSPNSQAAWQSATGKDDAALFATDPSFTMTGSNADRFKLGGSSPCLNAGRVGGLSGGATRHMGAWDGVVTQIGSNH
jgi:hypothetical protein